MNQITQHDFDGGSPVAGHDYASALGAPFKVYLSSGVETVVDPKTGKSHTTVIDLPGLIAAVVRARVMHPRKLSGEDLKFIRSALCLKSKALAEIMDLSPEYYSRCESGIRTMSTTAEKVCRGYVYLMTYLRDKNVRKALEEQARALEEAEVKEVDAEEEKSALAAFQKLFCEIKINPVCDAEEELAFWFSRRRKSETSRRENDAKWRNELEDQKKAA